ncbi:hypothetical protein ACWEO7_39180, partial [Nocardia sp. NPDC004260]
RDRPLSPHGRNRRPPGPIHMANQWSHHPGRRHVPLEHAPIDHVTAAEWRSRQLDMFDAVADLEIERGCSPWGCRGDDDEDDAINATWHIDPAHAAA